MIVLTIFWNTQLFGQNPIGNWKLDENTGIIAGDDSGNNVNGTISGAQWTSGYSGSALSFDGIDDYIYIPYNLILRPTDAITIEAWIYPTDVTRPKLMQFIDCYEYGGYAMGINGKGPTQEAGFGLNIEGTNTGVFSTTKLQNNQWYHIMGTYNGTEMIIYVNGIKETSLSVTGKIRYWDQPYPQGIGAALAQNSAHYNYFYKGKIDEVKIYDYAKIPENGHILTDERDGKQYNIVQIGDQWWMAENLAYLDSNILNNGAWVYNFIGTSVLEAKSTSNYQIYGALYDWETALNICPNGWHIPTDEECISMEVFLGMNPSEIYNYNYRYSGNVGKKMKSTNHWINYVGDNSSGFNGLPGGDRHPDGRFRYLNRDAYFWITLEYDDGSAWIRHLWDFNNAVGRSHHVKSAGFSVRCVKDEPPPDPCGIVGDWRLSEGTGNMAVDNSTYENIGTIIDANWAGNSLYFDGIDDHVVIPNHPAFTFSTQSFSVEAWVKTDQTTYGSIVRNHYSYGYLLAINNNGKPNISIDAGHPGGIGVESSVYINDNEWHHLMGVRDRNTAKLYIYVDGVLVGEEDDTVGDISTDKDLWLGGKSNGMYYYNGFLSNVKIWNCAQIPGFEPPVADAGDDHTYDCATVAGIEVQLDGSGSSNQGEEELMYYWSMEGNEIASGISPVVFLSPGNYNILLTVKSENYGLDEDEVVITINTDSEDPVILCPGDITAGNYLGDPGVIVDFGVTSTDNCDEDVEIVCDPPSGSIFPIGITTVECTATDNNGNHSTCSFTVTVTNVEPSECIIWKRGIDEPVLKVGDPGDWDDSSVDYNGNTVLFDTEENIYKMWYTGSNSSAMRIGYATSTDGITWDKYYNENNGFVFHDPECIRTYRPVVLKVDQEYKMYYCRWHGGGSCYIGLATSPDGLLWTPYNDNPVLNLGRGFEAHRVYPGSVIHENGLYKMWYTGEPSHTGIPGAATGYATSTDGIHWVKYAGNPVLEKGTTSEWDNHSATTPKVVKEGGLYHMFYRGTQLGNDFRTGHAYSVDGKNWTKCNQNPVLTPGPSGSWDDRRVGPGQVIIQDGVFKMWYTGIGYSGTGYQVGYATYNENSPPIAMCKDILKSTENGCMTLADVSEFDNGSYDPDDDPFTLSIDPPGPYQLGETTVILTVEDDSGLSDHCIATITVIDSEPPVIACPDNIIVNNNTGLCGAVVNFELTGTDNCDNEVDIVSIPPSGSFFPKGTTTIDCTATDNSGNESTCSFTVTVEDNEAPIIVSPENIIVNNDPGLCGAVVNFEVFATDNCDDEVEIVCLPPSGTIFSNGETTVECSATDDAGNVSTSSFVVIVIDVEPPIFEVVYDPIKLWPVNHKYVTIDLNELVMNVSDNCGIGEDGVVITMASSDEPEDAKGGGDGKTTDDIMISSDCKSVDLRAERLGGGNGRVYTINLSVSDEAGNETIAQCFVHVPHSVKAIAIDDGVGSGYSVESNCSGGFKDGIISDQNKLQIANELQFISFPNPFREETILQYTVPVETRVILEIYSIDGKKINILVNRQEKTGTYSVKWKGRDNSGLPMPNGIYLARIFAGNNKQTVRIVLQR